MKQIRNWYQLLEGSGLVANDSGPGAAHGALAATVAWSPYYFPPKSTINVAGAITPDATGYYPFAGIFNSKGYFTLNATWLLWWHPADFNWVISEALGVYGPRGWISFGDDILQPYGPYGTAAGDADVTCPYTIPYGYKGVTIAASASRIVSGAAGGFPLDSGSIEMLCRPSWSYADGYHHYFWDTYGGTNKRFILWKHNLNTTRLITNNINRGDFTFTWAANTLYHVVLNWGANQLYINGALVNTFSAGGLGAGAADLYIGDRCADANYAFSGIIYYFIARDVPLTLSEITAFRAFFEKQYIS